MLLKGDQNSAYTPETNKISSYEQQVFLESIFKIEYAKAVIANLPAVQRANCPGCQTNHSLEVHQCLCSTEEKIKIWFEDLLAVVDDAHVVEQYIKCSELLDCIEAKAV